MLCLGYSHPLRYFHHNRGYENQALRSEELVVTQELEGATSGERPRSGTT